MNYDEVSARIVLYTLGFIILLVVGNIIAAIKREKIERLNRFDRVNEKYLEKALNTQSIAKAKEHLQIIETSYAQAEDCIPASQVGWYQECLQDARKAVTMLETEEWEAKADKYLQEFSDCWYELINGDLESFRNVELFFKVKNQCISEWKKYFAIDISTYGTRINPKQYMREWLGDDYDPCMESREALEKRLDEYVQRMRPEQKRKNRLYDQIVKLVHDKKTIPQADLLRNKFPGYIEAEVKCCYNELIRRNCLIKAKFGSRWFVSLSEKELSKKKYVKEKAVLTPEIFAASIK